MPLRIGCRADDADKHVLDVNFLLYHKGKLYSASDDGKIKVWSNDLTKIGEVQAHPTSVYSLTANDDTLYSCSNDGTIKLFALDLKEKDILVKDDQIEFSKVFYSNGWLYSADNEGNVKLFKNNKFFDSFNVAEAIKDMVVSNNIVYTVKDVDLNITEVKLDGEKLQYGSKKVFMGKAPVALVGDKLVAFISREGKDIIVHENNDQSHFKPITKVEGAHEMIINTLAGTKWNQRTVLFSGGWDKLVKKWNIDEDIVKLESQLDVEIVVNSIAIGDRGEIYVGGGDGHIVRVEIE